MKKPINNLILENKNKNNIFISHILNENALLKEESNSIHQYLSECLSIGDRFIYELANTTELNQILLEQETTDKNQELDNQVLQLLSKYNSKKAEDIKTLSSADPKNSFLQKKLQFISKNVQTQTSQTPQTQSPQAASKTESVVSTLVSNFGNKIEKTSNQFSNTTKDPKKLQQILNSSVAKLKPILKGDDGQYLTSLTQLVQKNPGYANFAVGILINLSKMASVGLVGASGGTSLAVGAIIGIILRTAVGRLRGEDWKTAATKAIKVTGVSLLAGAALKGVVNMFHGDGLLQGFKSYFGMGGGGSVRTALGNINITAQGRVSKEVVNNMSKYIQEYVERSHGTGKGDAIGFIQFLSQKTGMNVNTLQSALMGTEATSKSLNTSLNQMLSSPIQVHAWAKYYAPDLAERLKSFLQSNPQYANSLGGGPIKESSYKEYMKQLVPKNN